MVMVEIICPAGCVLLMSGRVVHGSRLQEQVVRARVWSVSRFRILGFPEAGGDFLSDPSREIHRFPT